MRLPRVLRIGLFTGLFTGLIAGLFVLGGAAAGADCISPTIEYAAGPVDRGQEITVTGSVDVFDRTDQPLVVSDAPSSAEAVVATFGPDAGLPGTRPAENAPPEAAARPEPDSPSDTGPWVVGALVVLAVVAGGSMVLVRRH